MSKKLVCIVDGCGAEMDEAHAFVPPLRKIDRKLGRPAKVADLAEFVACGECKESILERAKLVAKTTGKPLERMFYRFSESAAAIEEWEAKREKRVSAALGTFADIFGGLDLPVSEQAPVAQLPAPAAKAAPKSRSAKKAPAAKAG
ncbi:MAG: hypothetical protein NTW66_01210 [Candidatus Magasanikbacteria bacterium]|nr:hypothetical protein [Candidatus Magasanikbacteria bacterium]